MALVNCRVTDHQAVLKIGGPGRVIELDESHFYKAKYHRGRQLARPATWVFGMTERGESHKIIVLQVADRTANTLVDLIEEWIEDGTYHMSDEWPAYGGLEAINAARQHGYIWQRVNHKVYSYSYEG